MRKRRIGFIIYIVIVLLFDFIFCISQVVRYQSTVKEIKGLTATVEIAEEFMRPEYNGSWQGIGARGDETKDSVENYNIYEYRILKNISDNCYLYFEIRVQNESGKNQLLEDNNNRKIKCIRRISDSGIEISTVFARQKDQIDSIGVYKSSMDSRYTGYFQEEPYYRVFYENGKYNVKNYEDGEYLETDRAVFEKEIGMTVEEIVDIAYEDKTLFEETMSEIKEYELKRNKQALWKRLLYANGISCFLILLGVVSKMIDKRYKED